MVSEPDSQKALDQMSKFIREYLMEKKGNDKEAEGIIANLARSTGKDSYNWLRFFVKSDPAVILQKVKCPVLAINGQKDCQVLAEKNINGIAQALSKSGNDAVTTKIFSGLNHLFQQAGTGLPDEYGKIEQTMDPKVPEFIAKWINQESAKH